MSIDGGNVKVLQTLKGHTSDVTSCDFAPNFTLVTGSSDKTVRIWDWIPGQGFTERPNSPLRAHKYQVTCVRVSPQGSMMASTSVDGTAILWNLHSAVKLFTMAQVNGDAVRVCRFAPDSSVLATAGDNGAICIWDLVHRSLIRTLFEHEGTTQSLTFTPDSQYLVSACSLEVLKVWYLQDLVDTTLESSCSAIARIDNAHDMGVFCMDISKHIQIDEDDPLIKTYKLATCGNSNEIKIWTIISKSMLKNKHSTSNDVQVVLEDVYDGHSSSVTCVRYSNSGSYLVSSSLDKLVKIWDQNGCCIATLEEHNRYVNCTAFSKDSALVVSGSNDKLILVWDLNGNLTEDSELLRHNPALQNHTESQMAENDGQINEIQLLEKMADMSEGSVNSCCFFGNEILATGSGDKLVRLFEVKDGTTLEEMDFSPLEQHTYSINHVEFSKDGRFLASCSQDGCTIVWNPSNGEQISSIPQNSLSVKVCRFSPDGEHLVTAGDDQKALVSSVENMEDVAELTGHLDSITSASYSPDGRLIATTSTNGDFRLWNVGSYDSIHMQEDAHDYGIQSCDFSQNNEPIPLVVESGLNYLLATCGNDGLVKLWRISLLEDDGEVVVKLWRSLQGHGGNVICVRFSPVIGEIVCSTATDRQARVWSVYSAECLFVLDHDSIVTSCSFTKDCSLLVTGCLDKTLWLWKLPQQLVFQTQIANKIKVRNKALIDWNTADVLKWLKEINMTEISTNVENSSLNGEKLVTHSVEELCSGLELDEEQTDKMSKEIQWLKRRDTRPDKPDNLEIPYEYLCPITHEIMLDPVTCSDGFTYERNAITEWFMSGKFTSPMTNEAITSTDYVHNLDLRDTIRAFLDEI